MDLYLPVANLSVNALVIIGLGGLGTPAATYLTGAGVGTLDLVDHDTIALSNLHRQFLFRDSDIGQQKVAVAAKALRAYNPDVDLREHHTRLNDAQFASLLPGAQAVLDCTDNFPTRFAINAACARYRIPLISGSGIGAAGQLGIFRHDRADSGCYQCLFGQDGEDTLDGGAGDDILYGGNGVDHFVFSKGTDRIRDFDVGNRFTGINDRIDVSGGDSIAAFANLEEVRAHARDLSTGDLQIEFGQNRLIVEGVTFNELTSLNFDFA